MGESFNWINQILTTTKVALILYVINWANSRVHCSCDFTRKCFFLQKEPHEFLLGLQGPNELIESIRKGFFYVQKQIGLRLFPLGWFSCKTFWSQCIMIILVHFSPCSIRRQKTRTTDTQWKNMYRVPVKIFQILAKDRSTMRAKMGTYLRFIWVKPFTESPLFVQKTKLGRRSRPKWRLLLVTQGMR